jgi:predicted amidophosphoribosyltransferase
VLKGFRDLISPRACLFCGWGSEYLCSDCFRKNFLNPEITYLENIPILSMSRYQDLVREIIVRHKDHHFVAIRKYMSRSLATGIKILKLPRTCQIISIPTTRIQITKRLDDPIRFMVSDAAKIAELTFNNKVLTLQASKKDQVGLSFWQREKNVRNIFKVSSPVKEVALCDDVVTSGATLTAANRVLTEAGVKVLANICVANTPKTMHEDG